MARRLDGFESRPQQRDMALAVERALDEQGRLMVEAGTGIGKTFAYLIPAIRRIVERPPYRSRADPLPDEVRYSTGSETIRRASVSMRRRPNSRRSMTCAAWKTSSGAAASMMRD